MINSIILCLELDRRRTVGTVAAPGAVDEEAI